MNTLLHLTAVLASLWASIFAFETLKEPALGGAMLVLFFGFIAMTIAALDDDLFLLTGRKLLGFRGNQREGISLSSKMALGAVVLIFFTATLGAVAILNLLSPGENGDSTTVKSPSGLELIDGELTTIRGCADLEYLQWAEGTDEWGCNPAFLASGSFSDSTSTNADSGLETISGDLTLIRGCSVDEILKWTTPSGSWKCAIDVATGFVLPGGTPRQLLQLNDSSQADFTSEVDVQNTLDVTNATTLDSTLDVAGAATLTSTLRVDGTGSFRSTIGVSGSSVFVGDMSLEGHIVLPENNDAVTPSFAFGNGDTGFYETPADAIIFSSGTTKIFQMLNGQIRGMTTSTFNLKTAVLGSGAPYYTWRGDINTGLGRDTDNEVFLVANGNEGIRVIGAGDIDLTPTANTDASASPILIQNESSGSTPGTTTDGQIRLWEDTTAPATGSQGRILFQVNGTTFQVNADAGLTFTNNPLLEARNKALFAVGHAQWKLDRVSRADLKFVAFTAAHPELKLVRMAPEWSDRYLDHLRSQYAVALLLDDMEVPAVPTLEQLRAENPWPDPATYTIASGTSDETVSFRTKTQFDVGDPLVLVVDRKTFNTAAGENWGVHAVPSTLTDEFIWLLQNDATFLNDIKALLGI